MCKRLKRALVESFVGAIALGWILAQGLMHLVNIFTAPLASWISRQEYRDLALQNRVSTSFSFRMSLPELAKGVSLLLICYILLRWLYFAPAEVHSAKAGSDPATGSSQLG